MTAQIGNLDCGNKLEPETFVSSASSPSSTVCPSASSQSQLAIGSIHPHKSSWIMLFSFTKWSHVWTLITALTSASLVAGIKTVLAVLLGKVFDVFADFGAGTQSASTTISHISTLCLVLFGLGAGNWFANTLFLATWIVFGELQAASARLELYDNLLLREMSWFDSLDQGIASLMTRIQTQTRELQLASSQVFGLLASDLVTSVASLILAFYYSWKLTFVLLATIPVSTAILSFISRQVEPAIQAQKRELAVASKHAFASITAIDLIKVFNGQNQELRQYDRDIRRAAIQYLIQARCNSFQLGYVSFWVISMFIVGIAYGIVLVKQGLNPGHVLTTFYATLATMQSFEALMPQWLVLAKGLSAGRFLSMLVSTPYQGKAVRGMNGFRRPQKCEGTVELNNARVSFAYPSNPHYRVLKESSLIFTAGQITFVVGRSGSGKSTLANLIANLYQPSTGDVRIDGWPLRVLDRKWLQRQVTFIQQSSVVFSDTIFNNIALGHPEPSQATKEQVLQACDTVLLRSTLADLPRGLDTFLGVGGHNLSGGQKQRLALARARLRDAPILVLDEVTSGLDQNARILVMDAIREWRRGRTTIIITHDVSQIGELDFVYVMDQSRFVQEGTKRDLLKCADGIFASLAALTLVEESPYAGNHPAINFNSVESSPSRQGLRGNVHSHDRTFLDNNIRSSLQTRASSRIANICSIGTQIGKIHHEPTACRETGPPANMLDDCADDLRRFSAFIEMRFFPAPRSTFLGLGDNKSELCEAVHLAESLESVWHSEDDSSFKFGNAKRRTGPLRPLKDQNLDLPTKEEIEFVQFSESDFPRKSLSMKSILKTVWPTLGTSDRVTLFLGLGSCFFVAAVTPAFSYCFAQLLSAMWLQEGKLNAVRKWAPILVAIAVVNGFSAVGSRYLLERAAQSWVDALRSKAVRRILEQPRWWFDRQEGSPGRISECLDRNAEEMKNIVGRFVSIILVASIMIIVSILWALAVSWKLTLVSLAPLPVFMGSVKAYTFVSGKWEASCNKGAEAANATLTEVFLNIRVVRALTLEKHFSQKYRRLVADAFSLGVKRAVFSSGLFGLYQSVNYGITALVFYYGTYLLAKRGQISATEVLQVVNLLLFGMGSAAGILSGVPQLTLAQATAVQMLAYVNLPMEPREDGGLERLNSPLPVRLNKLKFAYPSRPSQLALRGVSLEIKPGHCTAIVGHSGCGKSTLVSVLLGLYTPRVASELTEDTSLTYAGMAFTHVDLHHLRQLMAYVPQVPFVFPDTIAENIAYGLEENSPNRQYESICRAAREAGLHEFITSLPHGYATLVGDGGQTLSGGQAQRLNIARALVRRPLLLVLDEPTGALDAECADTIRHTIKKFIGRSKASLGETAVVLVTHNREMMNVADNIVVLERGMVVEEGTYHELTSLSGKFTRLVGGGELAGEEGQDSRRA